MVNSGVLPPEIMEDILLRLPAKSLGRFRCVAKPWKDLISSPKFIKAHLNRSSNHYYHHKLIIVSHHGFPYSVDLVDLEKGAIVEATALRLFPPVNCWERFSSTCNGLVLASPGDVHLEVLLINPTTQEYFNQDGLLYMEQYDIDDAVKVYGLGHDSIKDDYKFVVVVHNGTEEEVDLLNKFFHVYSFGSNRWRKVKSPPNDHAVCKTKQGVYAKGCLHWLCNRVSDSSRLIACFSFQDEEFKEVRLPSFVNDENALRVHEKLKVVSGCLCFIVCWDDNLTDIWIMKDYGVQESWEKNSIYGLGTHRVVPLWLFGDREIVLKVNRREVAVYNVKEKTLRYVEIRGIPCGFEVGGIYVESLVSPNQGYGLKEGSFVRGSDCNCVVYGHATAQII